MDENTNIQKLQEQVESLQANVKWLYKYGGTGSGRGSGSSSSSSKWGIIAKLDDTYKLTSNGYVLPQQSDSTTHTINISISRPGGLSFSGTLTITQANAAAKKLSIRLNEANNWTLAQTVEFTGNAVISIALQDNEDLETKEISQCSIIVNQMSIDEYISNDNDAILVTKSSKLVDTNIFTDGDLNSIGDAGLEFRMSYSIANIDVMQNKQFLITLKSDIEKIEGLTDDENYERNAEIEIGRIDTSIDALNGQKTYRIFNTTSSSEILNSITASVYNCTLTIYQLDSAGYPASTVYEQTLSFTIVPSTLFLKVWCPTNLQAIYSAKDLDNLYDEAQIESEEEQESAFSWLSTGYNALSYVAYYGSDKGRNFTAKIEYSKVTKEGNTYQYNWSSVIESTIIKERTPYTKNIPLLNKGVYAIRVTVTYANDGSSYQNIVYVGVRQGEKSLTYDMDELRGVTGNYNIMPQRFYGDTLNKNTMFPGDQTVSIESNILRQYNNGSPHTLTLRNSQNGTSDIMLSIGLQYSVINENASPLITVNAGNNEHIYIWQNKVTIGSYEDGNSANLYINKEKNFNINDMNKYHLLTLVRKNVTVEEGGASLNELIIYYDGVSIGAYKTYIGNTVYESLSFNNANYYVNFVEYATFNTGDFKGSPDETEVSLYYYKFWNETTGNQVSKDYINAISNIKFVDNGLLKIDDDNALGLLKDLSSSLTVPVLNLVYNRDKDGSKTNFITWFTTSYEEGAEIPALKVDVMWGNGAAIPLEFIDGQVGESIFDDNISNSNTHYQFTIKPQGSSTLQYKVKNLTLGIIPIEENCQFLFTPKFNIAGFTDVSVASESFMPEQKFVLKADHVDSAHANNTSVGRFVNKNTYKFNTGESGEENVEKYRNYIKNSLDGFPVLVFITEIYRDTLTNEVIKDVYYSGIYNFNMGRDSYFNLGYADTSNYSYITDAYKHTKASEDRLNDCPFYNGFGIYKIVPPNNNIPLKEYLLVAEIQGNEEYYDFSQFNESLLVKSTQEGDSENYVMFGDLVYGERYKDNQSYTLSTFVKCIADAGYALFKGILQKNFSTVEDNLYGYTQGYNAAKQNDPTESINQVPNTCFQFRREFNNSQGTGQDKNTFIMNNTWTPSYDEGASVQQVLAKQRSIVDLIITNEGDPVDAEPMLDYCSLVEYYTMCMVFGLVDSVKKNLNIKSWAAKPKFYIAFYDMDTSFGKDNLGSYVSYFAFSDYWKQTVEGNTLKDLYIYRDFYPKTQNASYNIPIGYDVPSSYLFAIAKYAQLSILDVNVNSAKMYAFSPESVYANLRAPGNGELRSAKYFVDNYFGKDLDAIPEALWSLNYRNKYLKHTQSAFDDKLITAFKGRSKDMVKDWLDGRLHILDTYFGLNNVSSVTNNMMLIPFLLNVYSPEEGWHSAQNENLQCKIYNKNQNDTFASNSDVLVLCDVFASENRVENYTINFTTNTQGIKKSTLASKMIDMSGLYLANVRFRTTGNEVNYIFPAENVKYRVKTPPLNNNQNISALGTPMTTYMERIDMFITQEGSFKLYSDYMTHICSGTDDDSNVNCSIWDIYCPSLQLIRLNSEYYSGTLTLNNELAGRIPMLNLDEINLSNSNIVPNFNKLNIRTLNLSNIGKNQFGPINVTGCTGIENLSLNGAKGTTVTIQYTNMPTINISGTSFTSLTIESIERNDDVTLRLENDPTITTLTVGNINHIYVSNCPNLNTIITQEADDAKIKTLSITNCCADWKLDERGRPIYKYDSNGHADTTTGALYIGKGLRPSTVSYELDLSDYVNLSTINFNQTYGFTDLVLPNKTINVERAGLADNEFVSFSGCENLLLKGDSIFKNSNFILTQENAVKLTWSANLTSLASMFERSASSSSPAKKVKISSTTNIKLMYNANNTKWDNITNVSRMLLGQNDSDAITTTSMVKKFAEDISFGRFNNLETANSALYGTGWMTFCKEILWVDKNNYAGKNLTTNKLNITNIIDSGSMKYIAINAFEDYGENVEQILWAGNGNSEVNLQVIGYDENVGFGSYVDIAEVKLEDLFKNLPNLVCLQGVSFQPKNPTGDYQTFDLTDCFKHNTKLVKINQAFNFVNFLSQNTITGLNNLGLKDNCKELTHICSAFNFNYPNGADTVDFINFIDWTQYCENNNSIMNNPSEYGSGIGGGLGPNRQQNAESEYLRFNKTITKGDLQSLLETINEKATADINIKYLFNHTTFSDTPYLETTAENKTYPHITNISYAFRFIHGTKGGETVGIELIPDSLAGFTNLIYAMGTFQTNVMRGKLPPRLFRGNKIVSLNSCFAGVSHETFTNAYAQTYNYWDDLAGQADYVKEVYNYENSNIKLYNSNLPYALTVDNLSENDYNYALNTYIVPDDIFDSCIYITDLNYSLENGTNIANIKECFADSDFIGIMPERLFRMPTVGNPNTIINMSFENTFRNVFLMPNKYCNITKQIGAETEIEHAYVYIPSNFTSRFNMTDCFNFRLFVPASQTTNEYNAYYLFKSDSFVQNSGQPARYINGYLCPNVGDIVSFIDGGGNKNIVDTHGDIEQEIIIHFGLCIDADMSAETQFVMDPIRKRNLSPYTDNYNFDHASYDGIDPSKVVLGEIFKSVLSSIYYGNIIKQKAGTSQTDISTYGENGLPMNTVTINGITVPTQTPVLNIGDGNIPTSLSKWMVLPYASTNIGVHDIVTANTTNSTANTKRRSCVRMLKLTNTNGWGNSGVDSFVPLKYWHQQMLCPDLMLGYSQTGVTEGETVEDKVGVYTFVDEIKQNGVVVGYQTRVKGEA